MTPLRPGASAPTTPPAIPAVTGPILAWYDRHRRRLPWRALPGERPDPYAVWLSEVMLQQTTVAAVTPYYARFLALWPTVAALAEAPVEEVMRAWAGLGYYSRARNLHAAAVAVAGAHGGRFPDTEAALRALPGVGAYTAAAVAAIAFGRCATVVDGNVERVMARLHAVERPPAEARGELRALMAALTPAERAGDFAQAVMDLGATLCTPRNPACGICPVREPCAARRAGLQDALPRRKARNPTRYRSGQAFYIRDASGGVRLRRRPPKGLLGGMAELPGTAWTPVEAEPPPPVDLPDGAVLAGRVTHAFTHFTLFLDILIFCDGDAPGSTDGDWSVGEPDLSREALPTLMRNAVALAQADRSASRREPPGSRRRRTS